MKFYCISILICIFSCNLKAEPIKILFIGNSFTHMNNFSQMISDIAIEKGDTIISDYSAIDSYTLEKHFSLNETIEKIEHYCWDYVVLQEQSQRPVMDSVTFYKTFHYAKALIDLITEYNPQAQPLLFLTWARKYGDEELCNKFSWTCTFEDMQDMLDKRYNLLGSKLSIPVVPCGLAWLYFAPNSPNHIDLFYEDNKHSNAAGSYLNACVFYSAITGKSTEGITYNPAELKENDLLEIQKIAYQTVKLYYYYYPIMILEEKEKTINSQE